MLQVITFFSKHKTCTCYKRKQKFKVIKMIQSLHAHATRYSNFNVQKSPKQLDFKHILFSLPIFKLLFPPPLSSSSSSPQPSTMAITLKKYLLLLLFISLLPPPTVSIGVNYGTFGSNLPPPSQVSSFLRSKTSIDRVKLFDCNPTILRSFASSNIPLFITTPNSLIPSLSRLPFARSWISSNISPFYPSTNISLIALGNEIMASADRNLIAHLVPAMKTLSAALAAAGFHQIRVSTPHSLGILSSSQPPSSGRFRKGYDRVVFAPMLDFHRRSKTPFVVNPYPYFGYSAQTLDYALFRPNPGVYDLVTGIRYTNMFDAQLDAVFSAMKRLGYGDVEIAIGETGWPTAAEAGQIGVSPAAAGEYVGNVIRHVESGKGTPLMPNRRFETYIFALFDEDLKPGPIAERNWGLFRPDFTPVYDAGVMLPGAQQVPVASKFCVAKAGSTETALTANINYACSVAGVDCRPIQPGGSCYEPNLVQAHASYAMNAYYQVAGRHDFNCDFGQTGVITNYDPGHGSCKFAA